MVHRLSGTDPRLGLLFCNLFLMIFACFNIVAMKAVADLPEEYQPKARGLSSTAADVSASRAILQIEEKAVDSPDLLRYYLCGYGKGDSVTVTDVSGSVISERKIALVSKYSPFNLGTMLFVGLIFFVFAIYVVVRHSFSAWAGVLNGVAVGTVLMILYEWGSLTVYPSYVNFFCWFMFDVAIWLLPGLFLHFSYLYPKDKGGHKRLFTGVFYAISMSGIGVSAYYLVQIFFFGIPIHDTPYLFVHSQVNDVFLIAGLLCTVANLEHSALAIQDPYDRKRIYWVLLGISFGPLVYIFLILVPRMMLEYELVSQSMMQYTLLVAPLMFYLAIRKTPNPNTPESVKAVRELLLLK